MFYNPFKTLLFIVRHPGNQGKRFKSLQRYIKWQISSRLIGFTSVMPWIDESFLYIRLNEAMVTHNYYTGIYEYDDMIFLLRYLNSSDMLVDIGANSGVYTVLAAKVKGATVLAFEPIPNTYDRLLLNVHLNKIEDLVKCVNKGLADKAGMLYFTTSHDATNHVTHQDEGVLTTKVLVSTLDEEVKHYDIQPTILKIDVEGFEYYVLKGGMKVLGSNSLNIVLIETNNSGLRYGHEDNEIAKILKSFGFRPYGYDQQYNRIIDINEVISKGQNTLFIKNIGKINQRLLRKQIYKVHPTQTVVEN
jgi:FkbM family methyltransferase